MPAAARGLFVCLLTVWLLGACAGGEQLASLDGAAGGHPADPYEDWNRDLLESNLWTYDTVVAPGVEAYRWAVPGFVRAGVSNAIDNLAEPRVFLNDLLQGEFERAAGTLARFAFNTTFGFGGLFDRASQMGLPPHDEDFGQTLAVHGVAPGPYLVLPLLGPTSARDALARVVDMAMDPANWLLFPVSAGANLIGTTVDRFARDPERLAAMRATSMDFYAALRDAWLQNRVYEIANGAPDTSPYAAAIGEDSDDGIGAGGPGLLGLDPLEEALDGVAAEDLEAAEPSQGLPHPSRAAGGLALTGL